jgi:hypothetical protein
MQAGEGDTCSGLPLKEAIDLMNIGFVGIRDRRVLLGPHPGYQVA